MKAKGGKQLGFTGGMLPSSSSAMSLPLPSPPCTLSHAQLQQAWEAHTELLHGLESPGLKDTLAPDFFQSGSLGPPPACCMGWLREWAAGPCRLGQWVEGSPLGPGPKEQTMEPEPTWKETGNGHPHSTRRYLIAF